jgi:H/ACA ribonucleoprotein complex subunit 4
MSKLTPPWEVKKELIVKAEAETDPKYGYPPTKRSLIENLKYGIVNIDKPAGPSSHEVTAWTRKILNIEHAGHGGTLED